MDFIAAGNTKKLLEQFEFARLFIEGLGWDRYSANLAVAISGSTFALKAVGEKRGMVAWVYQAPAGQQIPDRSARKKIQLQVAKTTLEHLIIFTDTKHAEQIWCWARREAGKPASSPEHFWYATSGNRGFLQKLEAIAFSLAEEDSISIVEVMRRAGNAFDVERVTKRFYDKFKIEHKAFLDFIHGITDLADREWYASLMLNRMMFIYFMQRKGFLNGERDYLRDRLARCQREKGNDKFYSFYRYFLLRLFHEGLGSKARNPELDKLLGRIPYLNGGLFEKHPIEERCSKIAIPDEAFKRIFAYFDRYQWHLDERPLRNDDEINPDVLGYIFEKYINQKQMGAYYTKEDITEYISKNAVIPFLFDAAKAKCKVAFENAGGPTIWDHLRDDPDRYIYPAIKHGLTWDVHSNKALVNSVALPADIAAGIANILRRPHWSREAPADVALATETWREVVARRDHYKELRAKLAAGEVRDINDLVTLNLNIRQFAQDVIERCENPDLLRAFWKAIEAITVLDPTCGSGAFLFAALNILEPLYETCLLRMEAFVADVRRSGNIHHSKEFEDFSTTLTKVADHSNTRYFVLKSIILNNLFGVDIMEEAVEICKLRLFLKLAAQVDPDQRHDNLGIEPLPDIDFNIRAGNTLVGYATYDELKKALTSRLDLDNTSERIAKRSAELQKVFDEFRARQIEGDGSALPASKTRLREQLRLLGEELNRHLASAYGVLLNAGNMARASVIAYDKWRISHQPFHWFIEFYGIMATGGFSIIIGNPPWREYASVKQNYTVLNYTTEQSGNLYALCTERSKKLLTAGGFLGFIVQLPIVNSGRMDTTRDLLLRDADTLTVIPCDDRPGKLFDGLQHCRSTIFISKQTDGVARKSLWTTGYRRWATEARSFLFHTLLFVEVKSLAVRRGQFPKIASSLQVTSLEKMMTKQIPSLGTRASGRPTKNFVFYQESAQYWVKATIGLPYYSKNGERGAPPHGRYIYFGSPVEASVACAVVNSSLFYCYFITYGDCFHVSDGLVTNLPLPSTAFKDDKLAKLGGQLMRELKRNATKKTIGMKNGDRIAYAEFRAGASKDIIDEIDCVLAQHYGLDERERDFIINYDIKFRIGADEGADA